MSSKHACQIDAPLGDIEAGEYKELAWGLPGVYKHNGNTFQPMTIYRPKCNDHDVRFDLMYSGICHSDVHFGMGDLGPMHFPMVPGHEILGKVVEVGSKVTKAKVGDIVGVGCMVDSCRSCEHCNKGEEQYCETGHTGTYASPKSYKHVSGNQKTHTFGGYSASNTVDERFVFNIPANLDLARAAPLMCAGITTFDPLMHWGAGNGGKMVGIMGIGGLGTMGIKIATAMGNTVVAISSSDSKKELALSKGAKHYVNYNDEASMKAMTGKLDLIIDVISANHQCSKQMTLLKPSGTIILCGLCTEPVAIQPIPLLMKRHNVAGSLIGGTTNTQELLNFCAKHQIYPDCETVTADKIANCWEKLLDNSAGSVRYVIDIEASKKMKENVVPL